MKGLMIAMLLIESLQFIVILAAYGHINIIRIRFEKISELLNLSKTKLCDINKRQHHEKK
jgi:hypothetical protein